MTHIFISYTSEDKASAERLAHLLEQRSWSVWWDRNIPPGKSFDQVIEKAIDEAACVIVLWSEQSVASNWVKAEAEEGLKRGILVPALIADVKIPLGFRRIQAAELISWQGSDSSPGLDKLIASVANILGDDSAIEKVTVEAIKSGSKVSDTDQKNTPETEHQKQGLSNWKTELVTKDWYAWKVRVHLTDDIHVITVRSPISKGNSIEVDGEEISRHDEIGLFGWTAEHDFTLADGSAQHNASIKVDHHWVSDKITKCQLIVNGKVIFKEGY